MAAGAGQLGYCKLCSVEDFEDPELAGIIREAFAAHSTGPGFPRDVEIRKYWEVAQAIRALRDFGAVHADATLLGVGAGTEQTGFWLTNVARRVYMTDRYSAPAEWDDACPDGMLSDPSPFALCRWDPARLVVLHMDALELEFGDGSIDGIFSSGSIEHFGGPSEIRRAAREMARVLAPGGIAAIATEFRLEGPPGLPGTRLFSEAELHELIVDAAEWELVEKPRLELSERTLRTVVSFNEAVAAAQPGGFWRYPHIVLRHGLHLWTSVSLVLRRLPG